MRTNTLVTLSASAIFGVMAIVLARGWIQGAVENEFRQTPTQANIAQDDLSTVKTRSLNVIVANSDLVFGDELTPSALRLVEMPEDAVPLDAISDMSELFPADYDPLTTGALILLEDIRMNEIILPHRISGLNGRSSLSARIRPGYRAVSIRVDDVTGVAGFIVPGDLVDIQYVSEPDPGLDKPLYRSDIILQSVRVLGIDQSHNRQQDAAEVARTVTLEVSHMDAQALAIAQEAGTLSLVLRAVGEALPSTTRSLDTRQLDLRANSESSAKKPIKPVRVTPKKTPPPVAQITVIRGDTRQSVSVRKETLPNNSVTDLAGG
jgi:pilus assembly protein CpaB